MWSRSKTMTTLWARSRNDTVLTFIEIQTGSLLSEDDIKRFDDHYGRLN